MTARSWDEPSEMTSVDEAYERIVSLVRPTSAIEVDLLEARGRVLAEDIVADQDVPPFRNSAMDGYAIRSADTAAAGVVELACVGTVSAGSAWSSTVKPGHAARIMTGAIVPDGADAVVRFEETERRGERTIRIKRAIGAGENIRLAGEDVPAGTRVLSRGRRLEAGEIGILAALNVERVHVHERPRIGILSTGDEVVGLGAELEPGQIRDANTYALAASVEALGALPVRLGIAADRAHELQAGLARAEGCQLLLTSGGVSVGDFDLVKTILRQEGCVESLTVRMKPGKPLAVGMLGSLPVIGLPGNPAAAIVSFDQFARPAIRKMLGYQDLRLPSVRARLARAVDNRGRRRHFERGILWNEGGIWHAEPTGIHGSAMLTSVAAANCYIVIDEACAHAEAGSDVEVQVLDPAAVFGRDTATAKNSATQ